MKIWFSFFLLQTFSTYWDINSKFCYFNKSTKAWSFDQNMIIVKILEKKRKYIGKDKHLMSCATTSSVFKSVLDSFQCIILSSYVLADNISSRQFVKKNLSMFFNLDESDSFIQVTMQNHIWNIDDHSDIRCKIPAGQWHKMCTLMFLYLPLTLIMLQYY